MRNIKRPSPLVDLASAFFMGITIASLVVFVISATIKLLWNFVMPIFGLPQIGYLHALALFLLFKVLNLEYKQKQNITLNASLVPVRKENTDDSDPRNKYPV